MLQSWATNHTKISDFASLSLNLHYWVYDYFTFYFIPTSIITINQGLNSFKCMIRRANLTSLYRWHSAGIPSAHWCYTAGLQTSEISDFASISLNLHHWVMITLLLNKCFTSTTITTTNQSYHTKHILYIYSTIIAILRIWL